MIIIDNDNHYRYIKLGHRIINKSIEQKRIDVFKSLIRSGKVRNLE